MAQISSPSSKLEQNYEFVRKKSKSFLFPKLSPNKQKGAGSNANSVVGPASYDVSKSFKNSQERRQSGFMSKAKLDNFISKEIKKQRNRPTVGSYNTDRGQQFLTSGASKGWK